MPRFLVVATVLALGCTRLPAGRVASESENTSRDRASANSSDLSIENAKTEIAVPLDDTILALVLDDFASRKFPLAAEEPADDLVIVVDVQSSGPSGFLSASQISADLMHEDWTVPAKLVEDLSKRNGQAVSLREKRFGKRVALEDLSQFEGKYDFDYWSAIRDKQPKARAYVHLWVPGYNEDQTQAVVRFSFGPTPHGATATYLLVKEDGTWRIQSHKLAYYA